MIFVCRQDGKLDPFGSRKVTDVFIENGFVQLFENESCVATFSLKEFAEDNGFSLGVWEENE